MFDAKERVAENYDLYRKFMDIYIQSTKYFYTNKSIEKLRVIDKQLSTYKYDRNSTT
jgi:hypothetical protein